MTDADSREFQRPVILFDGVCNLCNWWVNFVIDRDPTATFRFAHLQSSMAQDLKKSGKLPGDIDSIILLDRGDVFQKSEAIFKIAKKLNGGWPAVRFLKIFPLFFRDWVYDQVARNRYSLFGRTDQCRLPGKDLQSRFL
jgi:predicted DCC family thiol-disulfide oxidoreductase YuxK